MGHETVIDSNPAQLVSGDFFLLWHGRKRSGKPPFFIGEHLPRTGLQGQAGIDLPQGDIGVVTDLQVRLMVQSYKLRDSLLSARTHASDDEYCLEAYLFVLIFEGFD